MAFTLKVVDPDPNLNETNVTVQVLKDGKHHATATIDVDQEVGVIANIATRTHVHSLREDGTARSFNF